MLRNILTHSELLDLGLVSEAELSTLDENDGPASSHLYRPANRMYLVHFLSWRRHIFGQWALTLLGVSVIVFFLYVYNTSPAGLPSKELLPSVIVEELSSCFGVLIELQCVLDFVSVRKCAIHRAQKSWTIFSLFLNSLSRWMLFADVHFAASQIFEYRRYITGGAAIAALAQVIVLPKLIMIVRTQMALCCAEDRFLLWAQYPNSKSTKTLRRETPPEGEVPSFDDDAAVRSFWSDFAACPAIRQWLRNVKNLMRKRSTLTTRRYSLVSSPLRDSNASEEKCLTDLAMQTFTRRAFGNDAWFEISNVECLIAVSVYSKRFERYLRKKWDLDVVGQHMKKWRLQSWRDKFQAFESLTNRWKHDLCEKLLRRQRQHSHLLIPHVTTTDVDHLPQSRELELVPPAADDVTTISTATSLPLEDMVKTAETESTTVISNEDLDTQTVPPAGGAAYEAEELSFDDERIYAYTPRQERGALLSRRRRRQHRRRLQRRGQPQRRRHLDEFNNYIRIEPESHLESVMSVKVTHLGDQLQQRNQGRLLCDTALQSALYNRIIEDDYKIVQLLNQCALTENYLLFSVLSQSFVAADFEEAVHLVHGISVFQSLFFGRMIIQALRIHWLLVSGKVFAWDYSSGGDPMASFSFWIGLIYSLLIAFHAFFDREVFMDFMDDNPN